MEASVLRTWRILLTGLVLAVLADGSTPAGDGPPDLRLPPDVTYGGAEGSPGPVVFSHSTHAPLASNQCVACHPMPFSILRPTRRITHEEMNAGQKCGACHDGVKASGVQDDCGHCHRMEGGS